MSRSFRSRIDLWPGSVLVLLPLVLTVVVWQLSDEPLPLKWILIPAVVVIGVILPLSLLLFTYYTVDCRFLKIRHGVFRWTIGLSDITSVTSTRDAASNPALSLDRLRIDYADGRCVMISPADKAGFISLLSSRDVPVA
jgi:hypothetical protein